MASIHKRPRSPYFHASFRLPDGKQVLRSTRQTNHGKAMLLAVEWERLARMGKEEGLTEAFVRKSFADIWERIRGEKMNCPTSREYFTDWLDSKTENLASGTATLYRATVARFLDALGGKADKQLSGITPKDVENYIATRRRAKLSASTIGGELSTVIRPALSKALDRGIILTNPARSVDTPKGDSEEREIFTITEVEILLNAASDEWKTVILIGYYLGCRLTRCATFEWKNFDLVKGTMEFLPGKQSKGKRRGTSKPIPEPVLQRLIGIAGNDRAGGYITPTLAATPAYGRMGLTNQFKAIMRNAGVDSQEVVLENGRKFSKRSFHSLRHNNASGLANAGVAVDVRMNLSGHKSESVHARYTHFDEATLREAQSKLPKLKFK